MSPPAVLHETARRLRLAVPPKADLATIKRDLERLQGVQAVRINPTLRCVVVRHDGATRTRVAVLDHVGRARAPAPPRRRVPPRPRATALAELTPAAVALSVPLLPRAWRAGAALVVVATRVAAQSDRLRSDAPGVLLDAASLASLAVNGQPLVVSASVLLRIVSERLAAHLVEQTDALLDHLLPTEAASYSALRGAADTPAWSWWPLRSLRAGDRVRLFAGDVVPLDGCVVDGQATLAPAAHHAGSRAVCVGDHLAAGDRVSEGTLEMRAEADAAASRLERLRAHVRHAISARDPVGHLTPGAERLLSLPLTAATLVFGLTGDTARAAAMLQADPRQGLDLALPLAREAALVALARQGLLTAGLEAIERLASAGTLVLQDTGVLASGRWVIDSVQTEAGGDADQVRRWLAALADTPLPVLSTASFPDGLVRQWIRHGAVLRVGEQEVHLASRQRLAQVWGLTLQATAAVSGEQRLRRELAVVAAGRVVARVVLGSPLRARALARIGELAALGLERIAIFVEPDGNEDAATPWPKRSGLDGVGDAPGLRADWLADAQRNGSPLLMVHTVLRDLVPPGSLSLTPTDADAGSHGVLLGDPLASLVAARRIALSVHRRLRLQQGAATSANAALMTAAALRWLPPIATSLLHHGFALLLLLDSLRIEKLDAPHGEAQAIRNEVAHRPPAGAPETTRREVA